MEGEGELGPLNKGGVEGAGRTVKLEKYGTLKQKLPLFTTLKVEIYV